MRKSLTLYPQGLFEGDKPFDPAAEKPRPVSLLIEGFPFDLSIKSLKDLTYKERKQAVSLYKENEKKLHHLVFSLERADALILAHVEQGPLHAAMERLTACSFPIADLELQLFKERTSFLHPTLHVKHLSNGFVRLVYGDKDVPYLARFIDGHDLNHEIEETLDYIRHTFHGKEVEINHKTFSACYIPWWLRLKGVNRLWPWYWWPRLAAGVLGGIACMIALAVAWVLYDCHLMKKEIILKESHLAKLTLKRQHLPYQAYAKSYRQVLQIQKIERQRKQTSCQNLLNALAPVPQNVRFHDIAWYPSKQLMLLASFPSWQALTAYEAYLRSRWPDAKVTRTHQSIPSTAMVIQWDIRF